MNSRACCCSVLLFCFLHSLDDAKDPAVRWLKLADLAFVWEVRLLFLVPVIVLIKLVYEPAAYIIAIVYGASLLILDSVVSVLITIIFLRPIVTTMREARVSVVRESAGYRRMQRTKWMTLFGVVLTASSSTLLYVNVILQIASEEDSLYWTSPWLNFTVFGSNADSIVNDIGMMFLSGMARTIVLDTRVSSTTFLTKKKSVKVEPELMQAAGEPIAILPHHGANSGVAPCQLIFSTVPLPSLSLFLQCV